MNQVGTLLSSLDHHHLELGQRLHTGQPSWFFTKWGKEEQAAFEQLKTVFTTRPVLATPDLDKEFRVEADMSNFTTGGVLSIRCEDNLWRPVSFISKALNET